MRLLERDGTGEFHLTTNLPNDATPEIPPYAILSHTWGNEEVLFKDMVDGTAKGKKESYAKIQFCGDQAWRDGLKYFWVDTCCIDKSDAAELQGALNSMFHWYCGAAKCYDDGSSWKPAFRQSRWFTRGWTLQELIAPKTVEFFSKESKPLGDKDSLGQEVRDITGIPLKALQGSAMNNFSIEERMLWVKKRNTTREEDKAYSLFGIFDVHIPLLYGEGEEKAFDRLREKIDKDFHRLVKMWPDPRDLPDPLLEKQRLELDKGGLLADAYRWVFGNPDFNRWRHLPDSRLLWVKGDPGKGKTMLLCGIINDLEQSITTDGGNLAYFFCRATDSRINNATAQPRLLPYVPENTYPSNDAIAWIVLSKVLREMLGNPNLKLTYLLLKLIVQVSSVSAPVKWIVSSRNWVQIEEQLAMVAQQSRLSLELNAESVSAAVQAFIRHQVIYLSKLKRYDKTTETVVHEYLSSNANGTFLWVALVCQALADPKIQKRHSLTKLRTFPPGLDFLYARMMDHIGHSVDADLCKQILAVATIVHRPISLSELATLVEMGDDISDDPECLDELIRLCGSFLTLRQQNLYFVHQSAKDFLLGKATHQASRDAFNQIFPLGTEDANHTIFSRSLNAMSTVLQRDMYDLKAPGFPIDKVQTSYPDPLARVRYSCVFWVNHLRDSISDKDIPQCNTLDAVQTFLEKKYLYWLEALSLLRAMSEGIIAIRQLEGLLGHAHRFALSYRWIIEQAPLQALVKKKFEAEEPSWLSTKPVTLEGHSDWVRSVAFSPDGQRLASGSYDGTVMIWDPASGQCLQTLEGHRDSVSSVAFSPDGQRLASGSNDETVKIWDPASGQCLQTLEGHSGWVSSVAFSPDGQRLASGSDDETVKIWDPASGQCLQTLEGHSGWVSSVAFSPDGQRLASGSYDKTVKIWDPASGQCLQTLKGHSDSVRSVAFLPDGQRLASGSDDETVKIWDPASGQCLQTLEGYSDSVSSVAFSPDGQRLASGSDDKTVKIWDPASGQCLQTLKGHSSSVTSVAFSPDGQRLASGSNDETVKIWDPASGQCLQTLEGHSSSVSSVAFSPDGQRLASGSNDKTVKIWDPASGQCLQTLEGHSGWVSSVAFSPDGQRLASGSDDETVKIWDPASGQYLQTLEGHRDSVRSVAFSPDGQRLASGSYDGTVKIWDPASGQYLQTLKGHSSSVRSVAFSPDGQRLASGSYDGTVKIWDPASGQCLQTLKGHSSSVTSVAFSPDGQRLASGRYRYSLEEDGTWIICNGQNLLWLPPEYRASCFAVQGRMMSVGCKSGRVFMIGFSYDI
ncbi:HET-R [Lasiosphaeria ovina]|uniref:HET-R n=1 Tax=Lasiosphaeria ovina TaxID=92902 RepID=A0AAE0JYF0_9PEZI|nr:HET-R [Lasiosphaeria ovina]